MSLKKINVLAIFALLTSASCFCMAVDESEKNAQRETLKLEAIPKEQLSVQSLVDIYSACLRWTLAQEDAQFARSFTVETLQQHCQGERKNLEDNISANRVNDLDKLLVARFNDALQKSQRIQN